MKATSQTADFRSIRIWGGSQDRAFEELCYQLLRETADLPVPDAIPVRTGNPDGGVEWYIDVADGSQWGWQAKYIFNIDTLLAALEKTVKRVVLERPNTARLTFCIPTNLPAGTAGNRRQSARARYEEAVARWRKDIAGAGAIEFVLFGESELLERLSLPKHAGRRLFWFNEHYLGFDELERLHKQASAYAGDRYRPLLQVDLPIESDLQALGLSDSYYADLDRHRISLVRSLRWVKRIDPSFGVDIPKAFDDGIAAAQRLRAYMGASKYQSASADPLAELHALTEAAYRALSGAGDLVYQFEREARSSQDESTKKQADQLRDESYSARRVLDSINSLREFLSSTATLAVRRRAFFLTGDAGSGKTHLLLDGARKALDEHRPAVVIFGSRFGDGNLWHTISEQLGLPPLGADEVLGAFSACAEASSERGRRFVLAIDALNESPEPRFWARHLIALIAAAKHWPNVAVVVSCRTTYLDAVDPDGRREAEFVVRIHPGFAGREVEATHKYFEHYRLPEPRIPLLLPEFTVPLFLQFYCESREGEAEPPRRHEGRVEVFNRFLNTKIDRVARRLRPNAATVEGAEAKADVSQVVQLLLRECIRNGREWVVRDRVGALGTNFNSSCGLSWIEVVSGLEAEGVLTADRSYVGDGVMPVLRITFQAFADYLLLRERIGPASASEVRIDAAFKDWLAASSYGVLEAAASVLPELYGIELPDYLGDANGNSPSGDTPGRREGWYEDVACRALPYRSADSVTDRTIEILNVWLSSWDRGNSFFNVLFLLAPQPNHRLNGSGLHTYLNRMSMPRRDSWFGRQTYDDIQEGNSAASRLARWAARGPYPSYDAEIVELASIPLVWMLSSPNRFSRDWITKALVQLMRGHPKVLLSQLKLFRTVNDPYVWERLVTVAYGSAMRSTVDPSQFKSVLEFVATEVLGKLDDFVPDALMLDAARGLVEWGLAKGLLSSELLKLALPPYAIPPPGNPWTQQTIEDRYYSKSDQQKPVEESYSGIYWSVMGYGDFGRYVVESGLQRFSRVRLTEKPPSRESPEDKTPAVDRRKWNRFVRSLSATQVRDLSSAADDSLTGIVRDQAADGFQESLTDEQRRLLRDSIKPRRQQAFGDTRYPVDRARRWIFQRVISLGWKPDLFGSFDRMMQYGDSGRSAHKAERFGKKYQWIAYHELLARVANNFHVDPWSWGSSTFGGLYELGDRDIDPSLPPVPFDQFDRRYDEAHETTFPTRAIPKGLVAAASPDYDKYRQQPRTFLQRHDDLPTAQAAARVQDEAGESWILLEGILNSFDPETDDPGEYRGLEQWCHVDTWLVPATAAASAQRIVLQAANTHVSDLFDKQGHTQCCYLGELGWRKTNCHHRHLQPVELAGKNDRAVPIRFSTEGYTWEGGGFDCSISETVSVSAPSAYLLTEGPLLWSGDQTTWLDGPNAVAAFAGRQGIRDKYVLLVKEPWLLNFLRRHGLSVVVLVRGERRRLSGEASYREPWLEFSSAVSIDANGDFGNQIVRGQLQPNEPASGGGASNQTTPSSVQVNGLLGDQPSAPPSVRIGVLAYGSLIEDAGALNAVTVERVPVRTPFPVEFARTSSSRNGAPTLVPVSTGGADVDAVILAMKEDVSLPAARDMLYRRETHQNRIDVHYLAKSKPGSQDLVIKENGTFEGFDVVLYAAYQPNIRPLTAQRLARLAIESARKKAGSTRSDGISYLIAAKRNGITTPLSPTYEAEILKQTRSADLESAWLSCRGGASK